MDLVQRITRRCAAPGVDAVALREGLLDELRASVPFDFHAWLLTDPATGVGSAPHASIPEVERVADVIRAKYLTDVNRWTALAETGTAAASLLQATAGRPELSRLHREVLAAWGIGDVLSVVFADRYGIWGFLELWRRGGTPFGQPEVALLASLAPAVTDALRALQAATFVAASSPAERGLGPVVFLLDAGLGVVGRTPAGHPWLQRLLPPESGRAPVAASVFNVGAQLLAMESGVDDHPASARVHVGDGLWLTLRAARLEGPDALVAVTMEESSPTERLDIFARSHGLSGRESAVLSLLATGADTRDLARRMGISELTVQDHLKSVFAKTGAKHRQALTARALGVTAPFPA